jgi:TRAP-type mannitol/chloroaromatic compound transport system substrate-binding protein
MKITRLSVFTKALSFAVAVGVGLSATAEARTLKVQTSATASHFTLGFLNEKWVPKLKEMTGGSLEIELLPIRAVVPHRETPEAVSMGILDGDLTSINYFAGRDPSFALMGDLIAGYDSADQIQDFCANGGGKEMLQKMYDKFQSGVKVIGCGAYAREAFVSKVPIRSVADFKGVKVRSPEGLASEVFKRVGASPVSLPGSEVYTSLEKGVIDAADNSAYANNDANGLHKIAKFPIFPGIHSTPILQFTVSQSVWDKLTPAERTALDVWYAAAYNDMRRVVDMVDRELAARDRNSGDIEVIDWTQSERDAFREIAVGAWEDFAASSDMAKEVYDTHTSFMKKIGLLK